jgi:glycosyltransferase involved in cell wall biosynthesis
MRRKLLIIDQHQFGYLTDTFKYCTYLRETYDITYLGWDYGLKDQRLDGVRVVDVSRRGPKPVRLARLLGAAFTEMARTAYDRVFVVYFQGASILRCARGGASIFMDIRTGSDRPGWVRRRFDNVLLWLECILFRRLSIVSRSLVSELHLPVSRCTILPLGGDRRSETRKTFEDLRLLYIGTFDQRNVHLTIEAFVRFSKECPGLQSTHYDIIGSGPEEDERLVREALERYGCGDRVIVHGWIPNAEINPYLDRGNAGVGFVPQLRYYDCQPSTKVFEYLLAGMPTIATRTRENAAVITPENGVLVTDTAQGFYEGLWQWYDRRSSYDSSVIRESVSGYAWDRIVREHLIPLLERGSPDRIGS